MKGIYEIISLMVIAFGMSETIKDKHYPESVKFNHGTIIVKSKDKTYNSRIDRNRFLTIIL